MGLGKANHRVITSRLDWVQRMADENRSLPLGSLDEFTADCRNIGAAESCLRRAIEALLDLGRHLLGKIFGEEIYRHHPLVRTFHESAPAESTGIVFQH